MQHGVEEPVATAIWVALTPEQMRELIIKVEEENLSKLEIEALASELVRERYAQMGKK